ncbi:hypothetical protein [Rheinheimera sp.]
MTYLRSDKYDQRIRSDRSDPTFRVNGKTLPGLASQARQQQK